MMTKTQTPSIEAGRARLIKLIHVARRELELSGQLDEPGYREILRAATDGRHDSAANMSYRALNVALDRLKGAGFQVRRPPSQRRLALRSRDRKVRALWLFLHALDVVKDPGEQALAVYVKRIVKVDDLRFSRADHTEVLIETLKAWAMRFLPTAVKELCEEAVALHQVIPPSQADLELLHKALQCLDFQLGFDKHLMAWEGLTALLKHPIAVELEVLKSEGCDR